MTCECLPTTTFVDYPSSLEELESQQVFLNALFAGGAGMCSDNDVTLDRQACTRPQHEIIRVFANLLMHATGL